MLQNEIKIYNFKVIIGYECEILIKFEFFKSIV